MPVLRAHRVLFITPRPKKANPASFAACISRFFLFFPFYISAHKSVFLKDKLPLLRRSYEWALPITRGRRAWSAADIMDLYGHRLPKRYHIYPLYSGMRDSATNLSIKQMAKNGYVVKKSYESIAAR